MKERKAAAGYTYYVQVKDHKIVLDEDNSDEFTDSADLHDRLISGLGYLLDQYALEALAYGEVPSITIVLSHDEIKNETD